MAWTFLDFLNHDDASMSFLKKFRDRVKGKSGPESWL